MLILNLCLLMATTIQLSQNGTRILKIGVHYSKNAADLVLGAYTRVEMLNSIATLIAPDVQIKLFFLLSNSSESISAKSAFQFVKSNMVAVLAAGSSSRTAIVSKVLQNANIPQWFCCLTSCCASTSTILSNKTLYPNFFRTIPNDDYQGKAMIIFASRNGWKKVSILCTAVINKIAMMITERVCITL